MSYQGVENVLLRRETGTLTQTRSGWNTSSAQAQPRSPGHITCPSELPSDSMEIIMLLLTCHLKDYEQGTWHNSWHTVDASELELLPIVVVFDPSAKISVFKIIQEIA